MKQALNIIKISGPLAFIRIVCGFIQARFLMILGNLLSPLGCKFNSSALWMLKRQSSDRPSVQIFEHLLNNIFQKDDAVTILVPNYLEKGFCNILPFLPCDSRIKSYQGFSNSDDFDWIIIANVMLSSIADKLKDKVEKYELVLTTPGFRLLRSKGMTGNYDALDSNLLKDEIVRLNSLSYGIDIIKLNNFSFHIRPKTMDAAIINEVETEYFVWLEAQTSKFDTIIDMGAQIGGFSVCSTQFLNENGKVFSYEPEPSNFEFLTKNVAINNLSENITAREVALSNKNGKADLSISSDNTGGNKLGVTESSSNSTVQVITLDALEELEKHIHGRSLLKIDVEGWEYPILKRIEPLLGNFEFIIGELQFSQFGSTEKSLDILLRAGFEVETKGDKSILLFYAKRKKL